MARAGGKRCDCSHRANIITVSNLLKFSHWKYCDTEASITAAAKNIAGDNIAVFSFVLEEKLFKKFFNVQNGISGLIYLLAVGGIDFESYQYSEDTLAVTFSKIKPNNSFTVRVSALSELKEIIKDAYSSGKAILDLWLTPTLFKQIMKKQDLLFSTIRDETGIDKEISYSYNQEYSRIKIQVD